MSMDYSSCSLFPIKVTIRNSHISCQMTLNFCTKDGQLELYQLNGNLSSGIGNCPFLSKNAKARAAEPDSRVPACVVVLQPAGLPLCPADCLQAEWAQRKSRSLATCEHSPQLLSDLTLNSFEDCGKKNWQREGHHKNCLCNAGALGYHLKLQEVKRQHSDWAYLKPLLWCLQLQIACSYYNITYFCF